LKKLNIAENKLTGTSLFGLLVMNPQCRAFLFHSLVIAGSIPSSLGNLAKLDTLRLQKNNLTGPLPASIFSATLNAISPLFLYSPCLCLTIFRRLEIGPLTDVFLQNNEFSGTLDVIVNARNIRNLFLGNNAFVGPTEFFFFLFLFLFLFLWTSRQDACAS